MIVSPGHWLPAIAACLEALRMVWSFIFQNARSILGENEGKNPPSNSGKALRPVLTEPGSPDKSALEPPKSLKFEFLGS